MSIVDDIREMYNDSILLGKKAIVCDIKIKLLKMSTDEIKIIDLIKIMDTIIEREEMKYNEK